MKQQGLGQSDPNGHSSNVSLTPLVFSAFVMCLVPRIVSAGVVFGDPVPYPAGNNPALLSSCDLDGDGFIDVVLAGNQSNGLRAFLNNGDGSVAPFTPIGITPFPSWVETADLDGNDSPDVVTADFEVVTIFFNDGTGTFSSFAMLSNGDFNASIDAADLDGDSDIDLVVGNEKADYSGSQVSVFLNNGDGTFGTPQSYDTTGAVLTHADVGDVDGDGDIDIAAIGPPPAGVGWWDLFLNNGDGTFAKAIPHPAEVDGVNQITLRDIDSDGDTDAFFFGSTYPDEDTEIRHLRIFENDGTGNFTLLDEAITPSNLVWFINTADLDSDGDVDVVTSTLDSLIGIYLNNGDGTFAESFIEVGVYIRNVVATDLNNDGGIDLVAADGLGDEIFILLNSEGQTMCHEDTDANNIVDVDDLIAVVLAWGTDGSETNTDVDGSGEVDVDDLLAVILAWGPCS